MLGVLVSLVSLGAVAWWIARQEAPRLPDSGEGWRCSPARGLVIAFNFALRGLRWHGVMRYAHVEHRRRDAFGLTLVGYAGNNVLPARGGELLKIGILGSRTTARHRDVLGTVVVERVLDAGVLAALFVALTWADVDGSPGAGGSAALGRRGARRRRARARRLVWLRRRGRFERFAAVVRPVARAAKLFTRPAGIPLVALSLAIWCLDGVSFMADGEGAGHRPRVPARARGCRAGVAGRRRARGAGLPRHVRRRDAGRARRGRHRRRKRGQPAAAGALHVLRAGDGRRARRARARLRRPAPARSRGGRAAARRATKSPR